MEAALIKELGPDSALSILPEELRRQIFGYLEYADLASLAQVSTAFRQQADDDDLWQPLYTRHVWTEPEGFLPQSDECWKQVFTRRVRIEKHGSGPAFGRENDTICFLRDGILVRTVAAEECRSPSDVGEANRGIKRKRPGSASRRLYAADNQSAIAFALQRSLAYHGAGAAAAGSSTLAEEETYHGAQGGEKRSGIFDRLLSVSVDLQSAARQAQEA
ncbi:hypothetical protein KFL_000180400 [Klebsormidium nitens]|uniref:F-box domain-containing protein n=1 Tax=Klebsormidium nitens TaxID=105231 RepID=A0A1Y1HQB7_KLENI|nr:hypothetical protein KFL_000180400 [Klebsormidium nitens]|eukprot:GAQ78757.1 hypothetical protein KFL_000180400 [Klebsormidium nitens]